MQTMDAVGGLMKTTVERGLLKHAAGSAIFCPSCQSIMDWKRTVLATVHAKSNSTEEKIVSSWTLCGKCWDKIGSVIQEGVDKFNATHGANPDSNGKSAWLEVVDGRSKQFKGAH